MSDPQLVRAIGVAPQRWRNGFGTTRVLLEWPDAASWRARVSVADVDADAPFSAYPGVSRWLAVLNGAGVELRIGEQIHRITRTDAPLRFDGGTETHCRLIDGPTTDLNLMVRGGDGVLRIVEDGLDWSPAASPCGMFTAVAGCCRSDDTEVDVPAHALLWFTSTPAALRFVAAQRPAGAVGWWWSA